MFQLVPRHSLAAPRGHKALDLLFYSRNGHDSVPSDVIGHRCVCEDEEGMGWVKQVKAGDEPGLFHLISLNPGANNIWNARLKWAARVRLHWPSDLARSLQANSHRNSTLPESPFEQR